VCAAICSGRAADQGMKQSRSSLVIAAAMSGAVVAMLLMSAPATPGQAEQQDLIVLPTVPPTPTVPPAPARPATGGAVPQSATTRLADAFDTDVSLGAWRIVDLEPVPPERQASWIVADGRLQQNRTVPPLRDPSIHETAAIAGDASWSDYTISASFYDQENANVGLIARRQGDSYYRYRIIRDDYEARPKHLLEKVVNGDVTIIASLDASGYGARTWHSIALSVSGSQLRAYFDGQPTISASDTSLAAGEVGLYTRAIGGMLFDNVTVTSP